MAHALLTLAALGVMGGGAWAALRAHRAAPTTVTTAAQPTNAATAAAAVAPPPNAPPVATEVMAPSAPSASIAANAPAAAGHRSSTRPRPPSPLLPPPVKTDGALRSPPPGRRRARATCPQRVYRPLPIQSAFDGFSCFSFTDTWTLLMNLRQFSSAFLFVALLAPAPGTAWAEASDEDKGTARTLLVEGNDALDKKDYARALSCFERADALFHAPTILIGSARARAALGKLVGAREAYNRIVNETVPPNASPAFLKAIEDARVEVTALMPRVPSIIIDVQGADLSKVSATIDGASIPNAALGVKRPADPGKHVVRVGGPGFETSEVSVTVAEGKTETVTVQLKAGEGTPPVATEAPVGVGGRGAPIGPPPGAEPRETGNTLRTVGWVSLGVGAAGLVVGGVTGGMAIAKHGDIVGTGNCTNGKCLPSQQSDVNTYNTLGGVSTAGFIAGGVLAATGAVLIFTAPKRPQAGTGTITPMLGLGYLGARGTF